MGIEERRSNEKTEMRKLIMNAAIKIINEEGYENLSIRKIANQIEYSPTTVYLYYKDKAQIIKEISNELYRKVENNCIAVAEMYNNFPVDERLHKILLAFIDSLITEPEMAKSIMLGGANTIFSNDEDSELPNNQGITKLEQILSLGVQQGTFSVNILGTSWMIISALLGFVLCVIENQIYRSDDFSHFANRFVGLLIGGVVGCENGKR